MRKAIGIYHKDDNSVSVTASMGGGFNLNFMLSCIAEVPASVPFFKIYSHAVPLQGNTSTDHAADPRVPVVGTRVLNLVPVLYWYWYCPCGIYCTSSYVAISEGAY